MNTITLELTELEAKVIRNIFREVGGPTLGLRGQVDSIIKKLDAKGNFIDSSVKRAMKFERHALYFTH